jgi:hypothetical protein
MALLRRPHTLSITETVYRRQIRPFGKTPKSLAKFIFLLVWQMSYGSGR